MPVKRVHEQRRAARIGGQERRDPPERAGFREVRVHDVGTKVPQRAHEIR